MYMFVIILVFVLFWYITRRSKIAKDCIVLQTIQLPNQKGVIQIVNDECQEGLPHTTTATVIRMTPAVWNSPRRDEILRHEQVHLSQKSQLARWNDFYRKHWDYVCSKEPSPDIPKDLVRRLRPNPDTADSPWALWRGRYMFFPIFDGKNTLKDARILVWDTELHKEVDIPSEWRAEFCDSNNECPNQYEHPHEISAEWLTRKSTAPAANSLLNFYAESRNTE